MLGVSDVHGGCVSEARVLSTWRHVYVYTSGVSGVRAPRWTLKSGARIMVSALDEDGVEELYAEADGEGHAQL